MSHYQSPPQISTPLWSAELDGAGDHTGLTLCEGCRQWIPNDIVKYVTKSPQVLPFHHMCPSCIKSLPYPVVSYEDVMGEQTTIGG